MPSNPELRLGERIRQLREANGWSQGFLARKIGVSRPTVTQWESGDTKNIKHKNLLALCKALDISLETLLTGKSQSQVAEEPQRYGEQMTEEERVLLEKFRALNNGDRRKAQAIINAFDAEEIDKKAK